MHSPVPNVVILLLAFWKDTGLSPSTTTSQAGLPTGCFAAVSLSLPGTWDGGGDGLTNGLVGEGLRRTAELRPESAGGTRSCCLYLVAGFLRARGLTGV